MLSEQELTQFGVELKDEFSHPYSQNHNDWNESYFFDWYTDDGSAAGHCRIGWHPVQQRILFWLHLWNGSEWLLRLPAVKHVPHDLFLALSPYLLIKPRAFAIVHRHLAGHPTAIHKRLF